MPANQHRHPQGFSPSRHAWRDPSKPTGFPVYQLVAARVCTLQSPEGCRVDTPGEQRINAAKRSAVSTGQLRRLPAVHTRPIDLVVFQEPSPRRAGDLVLKVVSRLDAFSVYPCRTLATQRCR